MAYKEATDRELYTRLVQFYPVVEPGQQFTSNLFREFEEQEGRDLGWGFTDWAKRFENWLPEKVGLLRNPDDSDKWNRFIVVDQVLYTFAILRYS